MPAEPTAARNAIASLDGFLGFDPNRPIVVRPAGTGAQPTKPEWLRPGLFAAQSGQVGTRAAHRSGMGGCAGVQDASGFVPLHHAECRRHWPPPSSGRWHVSAASLAVQPAWRPPKRNAPNAGTPWGPWWHPAGILSPSRTCLHVSVSVPATSVPTSRLPQ
jgi:hypothetical protein